MEAFSLLKYWRAGGNPYACVNAPSIASSGGGGSTITSATTHRAEDMEDNGSDDEDDGPFFDLELALPDEDETEENEEESEDQNDKVEAKSEGTCSDDEREFSFTLSSSSSNDRSESDPNVTLSPTDDLFFKGRLVSIEPDSCLDSKPTQFNVSLLKSATKFRVFMLKFKKWKLNSFKKTESVLANNGSVFASTTATPEKQEENNNKTNKSFTVKFKVEEVPIISLFSRDNSKSLKQQKHQIFEDSVLSDENKFSKDVMRKYLNKVKPLYVKVSRRYSEKLGSLKPAAATPPSTAPHKSVTEKGLRVVCKHLGKSRSASSSVEASSPTVVLANRRDDSLLQHEDGIQSAILHCKRSLNGSARGDSICPLAPGLDPTKPLHAVLALPLSAFATILYKAN